MSTYAKGLEGIQDFFSNWARLFGKRFNRNYDRRDLSLAEALKNNEARPDSMYPAITRIDADLSALSVGGSALTGIAITGTNLIGDAEQASGSTSLSSGQATFTSILPGERTITITLTNDGAAAAVDSADPIAGTIAISHGSGGSGTGGVATVADLIALIAADPIAKFMVVVTEDTAGDIDADETVTVETSSADPGTLPEISFGATSMFGNVAGFGFTAWTDTEITMDLDPTGLAAGDTEMFRVRIDDVLVLQIACTTVA